MPEDWKREVIAHCHEKTQQQLSNLSDNPLGVHIHNHCDRIARDYAGEKLIKYNSEAWAIRQFLLTVVPVNQGKDDRGTCFSLSPLQAGF